MSAPFQVLVADDHAATRSDIAAVLDADARFTVVAAVGDAPAAVAAAVGRRPDVALLDVNMPGSGIAAAWEIAARLPRTPVVMLTVSEDKHDLLAALRAGAAGYLLKDMDRRRLPDALHDVASGSVAIPRSLVAHLVERVRDRDPRRRRPLALDGASPLTSREWEVLELLREGQTTAAIASRLVVSQATVRSHVAGIVRKLGVADRAAAVERFERR